MKKIIALMVTVMLLMIVFSGCSSKDTGEISIYFKDIQSNSLNEEKRPLKNNKMTAEEKAKQAVGELISGPTKENSVPLISDKATLLKLEVKDFVATVNISSHYSEKKGTDELLLRNALVKTLCSIDGIDAIVIQVEGKPLIDINGKELGRLSINDYIDLDDTQVKEVINLKLYFPADDGSGLEEETRKVEVQNALSLEKTVVNELMNGPSKKTLSPSIPTGTKLISIETKDGVCTVNFSGEFISNTSGSTYESTLILYSVVNSLCELDSVESVQILINGKSNEQMGDIVFDIPYEADKSYVK